MPVETDTPWQGFTIFPLRSQLFTIKADCLLVFSTLTSSENKDGGLGPTGRLAGGAF